MARSYLPSKVSEIVSIWRKDLNKVTVFELFVMLDLDFVIKVCVNNIRYHNCEDSHLVESAVMPKATHNYAHISLCVYDHVDYSTKFAAICRSIQKRLNL
jgi:hypothetical protein